LTFGQIQPGEIDISNVPFTKQHYEPEYTFDTIVNPNEWLNEKAGLNVSWGSTDTRYFRREVPHIDKGINSIEATLWKGERFNATILVWSPDTLRQVRFILSNLINDNVRS
jgi:hypothetical protein